MNRRILSDSLLRNTVSNEANLCRRSTSTTSIQCRKCCFRLEQNATMALACKGFSSKDRPSESGYSKRSENHADRWRFDHHNRFGVLFDDALFRHAGKARAAPQH